MDEQQVAQRMAQLSRALDEEVAKQPPPAREQIEQEIADLLAEAPELGEDPAATERDLRQMSFAFWRDWFAVDDLMAPLRMTEAEVWQLCLAREAARKERIFGAQA
jgi:hypothetical protein